MRRMDIAAHALWVGAGLMALRQRGPAPGRTTVAATLSLAVLPDLVHLLPVLLWSAGSGSAAALAQYVWARPGGEPDLPAWVAMAAHHLHCTLHSGVVALLVLALLWRQRRRVALPMLAWASHIVIDALTHSQDFYPSPIVYPISYWGLDGVAWNSPVFQAVNYAALAAVWGWLMLRRGGRRPG